MMNELLEQVSNGDHFSFFYRSREEQFAFALPFTIDGLKRNERCLYMAHDNSVPMIIKKLEEAGVPVSNLLRSGQLQIATKKETFLKHGIFQPERMVQDLKEEVIHSLHQGYKAFRASGEMTWALETPFALEQLAEYECKLHAEFPVEFIGLCQYDETRFSRKTLSEMIRIHPLIITRGKLIRNREVVCEHRRLQTASVISVDEFVTANG